MEDPLESHGAERAKATVLMMYLVLSDDGRAPRQQVSECHESESPSVWTGFPSREHADRVADRCLSEMGFRGAKVLGI